MGVSPQDVDPDRRPVGWRGAIAVGGALLLSLSGACFTGAGAEGLPCDNDDDCGLALSCDEGTRCCGGPCLDEGTTTATTTTSTTSTTDPTTSSTTDPTTSSTTDPTGSTGPVGECGDGEVNDALGEECDLGTSRNNDPFGGCTPLCRRPAFLYVPLDNQVQAIPQPDPWGPPSEDETLRGTPGWVQGADGTWRSGAHPDPMPVDMIPRFGIKRVPSVPFQIDVGEDERAVVYIDHELDFATCEAIMTMPQEYDGARLTLRTVPPDGGMPIFGAPQADVGQAMTNIDPLEEEPMCAGVPWASDGFNAFVLQGAGPQGPFVLPAEAHDKMVSLQLEITYTCGNCGGEDGDEWVVNAVSVIVEPPP